MPTITTAAMSTPNDVTHHILEMSDGKVGFKVPHSRFLRRTRLLHLALLLVTLIALIFFIVIIIYVPRKASSVVCVSPACIKLASEMLQKYDPHVDPCEDFYEYACGGWTKSTMLDTDQNQLNTMGLLRESVLRSLKRLVEAPLMASDGNTTQQVKYYYQACMNHTELESRGAAPMMDLIAEFGGWPVLDADWDSTKFDLEEILARLLLFNKAALVKMMVYSAPDNASLNVIRFHPGSLGMGKGSQSIYREGLHPENHKLQAYLNASIRLAELLGADTSKARAEMTSMVNFEVHLAQLFDISAPDDSEQETDEMSDDLGFDMLNDTVPAFSPNQKLTLAELQEVLEGTFDVRRYLRIIFRNVSVSIDDSDPVRVLLDMNVLRNCFHRLHQYPPRVLQNYFVWRILARMIGDLPDTYQQILINYRQVLTGATTLPPRWETCIKNLNQHFSMAMGQLFVRQHFTSEAKIQATHMIHGVQRSFVDALSTLTWMDDVTRAAAIDKAEGILVHVGYPDFILDENRLREHYLGIQLDPFHAFENDLKLYHNDAKRALRKLHVESRRDEWDDLMSPSAVTAGYLRFKNQVVFPAAILQPPFFHNEYPKSVNYGGIGVVIGHEITHGFSSNGRKFDRNGNFRDWFSDQSAKNFDTTAQCFSEQFDDYVIPEIDMNVNGHLTVGENIADTGGLKLSWKAYEEWAHAYGGSDVTLPGLNYTQAQLFFMSFAQMWCNVARPRYLESTREWDAHSPNRFRVIGTLSNSPDFSKAFSCSHQTRMNPDRKCAMW